MESSFETLKEAGIDTDQFWELEEKDLANMGLTMGMRLKKGILHIVSYFDLTEHVLRCKMCSYTYYFLFMIQNSKPQMRFIIDL